MFALHTHNTQNTQKDHTRGLAKGYPIITGVMALALFIASGVEFFTAWILRDPVEDIHLWHIAQLVALAILLGFVLISLMHRAQEKPLLAQFIVLTAIITTIAMVPFEIKAAALILVVGLLIAAYPKPRALLGFTIDVPMSIPMLVLTLIAAVFLAPIALREIQWQALGMNVDLHAKFFHWIGSALLMALLVVAGGLASTKQPGWKQLSVATGVTYIFLGIIAIIVPLYAGSWGYTGGILSIFTGMFYIALMIAEAGTIKQAPAEQESAEQQQESISTYKQQIAAHAEQEKEAVLV